MNTEQLEKDLWSVADNLRANTDLKSNEYAMPVLDLISLKFADNSYSRAEKIINAEFAKLTARANRVVAYKIKGHSGQFIEKNGDIVDYYNVFRNMKKALNDYAQGEGNETPVKKTRSV